MASLGDLTLFISAETGRAKQDINDLGRSADAVVNKKREFDFSVKTARNNIRQLNRDINDIGKALKLTYDVAKRTPLFDDTIESAEALVKTTKALPQISKDIQENAKAGNILAASMNTAVGAVGGLVNGLAKVGFALYGLQQITGTLGAAFGGFFKATIGQEIALREQILKTQTALASTNDVFADGKKIEEPYKKILALTGAIEDRIESIRKRSLDLAGVTSGDVVEVFSMVAQQIGSIGGNLKDAEDLAIAFSGALGTFGIPLYQARQEVGSILRGDITTDSYLAKALGITNEDVKKAKQTTEGVVGFLNKKLATAVAGQAIAAKTFSGVTSNFRDLVELLGKELGAPLVDPLVASLNKVYEILTNIKDQAFAAAKGLGSGFARAATLIGAESIGQSRTGRAVQLGGAEQAAGKAAQAFDRIGTQLESLANKFVDPLRNVFDLLVRTVGSLTSGLKDLAEGFVGIKVEVFRALLSAFQNLLYVSQPLVDTVSSLLSLYGQFLQLPLVQYFSQVGAQLKLLEVVGVTGLVKVAVTGIALRAEFARIVASAAALATAIVRGVGSALAFLGTAFTAVGQTINVFIARLNLAIPELSKLASQFVTTGASATKAAGGMGAMTVAAGRLSMGIKALGLSMLKWNLIMLGITLVIGAVIDQVGRFQKRAEQATRRRLGTQALQELSTTLKDVGENSDAATRAYKELQDTRAQAYLNDLKEQYGELSDKVAELTEKIKKLKAEQAKGVGGSGNANLGGGFTGLALEKELKKTQAELDKVTKQYVDEQAKYEAAKKQENLKKEIETRAQNLSEQNEKLAEQQKRLSREVAQAEFSARMELARAQIAVFQAGEELRIRQLDIYNRKLIDGQEGASAAALEALNTYLVEKEKGETNIEARRREFQIRAAEIEREIENYKFDIAQKILELKKQGAKIDMDAADYVKKQQELTSLGGNPGAGGVMLPGAAGATARVGSSGRSSGPHLDIRGPNRDKVVQEAEAIIKAWQQMGVKYMVLSNINKDITKVTDSGELRRLLKLEQEAHDSTRGRARGASSGAIDIAVPMGTPIPVPVGQVGFDPSGGGYTAASGFGLGNRFLHLQQGSKATAAGAAPARPSMDTGSVAAPSTAGVESAKRGLIGLNSELLKFERLNQEITNGQNLDQFFKTLAPKIPVEQFKDVTVQVQAFAEAAKQGMDPERVAIYGEQLAKLRIMEREMKEAIEEASKVRGMTAEKLKEIEEELRKRFYGPGGTKEQLDTELQLRLAALNAERQKAAILDLMSKKQQSALGTTQGIIGGAAQMQAQLFYDPRQQQRILAEGELAQESARLDQTNPGWQTNVGPEADALRAQFEALREQKLFDADRQGEFDALRQNFQMLSDVASGVGQAIGSAMTTGLKDVMTGAKSVQEVLAETMSSVADSFFQMAAKIIADMVKMLVLKSLLGIFGGPASQGGQSGFLGGLSGLFGGGGGGGGRVSGAGLGLGSIGSLGSNGFSMPGPDQGYQWLPNITASANGNILRGGFQAFAKGGMVNKPTLGLVGEGAYNEAIVPLPNGKAIPVDMKGEAGNNVTTNITVNVDNQGGTQTEMTGDQAGKLGKAIDNAVKRVILEERRPGGMLSGR